MAEERKDLPAATSDNFAARARETLMTYLGRQGDPLDRGITLRDLVEGGIVAVREGFSLGGRGKLPIQPAPSLGSGSNPEEVDPTPPPTPTGLKVAAGITNLIIEHDAPLYSQGHGHARTLVYGAKGGSGTPPVFGDAVKIHEFTGTVSAYVTDPATTWHLWIKWVSVDGFASALPGGGINGVSATTGQDPAKVLQMLTGQITESQLYADLGERIDLIDGNGPGSVNARIETEATTLATAISAEAQARQTLAVAVGQNTAALQTESTTRANADSSLAQQITTVQAVLTQSNLGKPLPLWNLNGQSIVTLTDGKVGNAALRLSGVAGAYPNQGYLVPIDRSKQYRTRFWARPSADAAGLLYFSLRQFLNESGAPGPVNNGRSPYKPSAISRSLHDSTHGAGQWGEYSFVWSSSDWQAGVAFVAPEFLDNYSGAAGYWDIQDFTFTEVTAIENLSASVQTEATAQANTNGVLLAKYTVKVDVNGYVSGFGLASEANNAAPTSTFAVRADTFYIASPSGPDVTPALPFIVKTTPGAWGPAGVYIQEALIANAAIGSAKIANAAIDDAKVANLSAAKLTAGDGTIGGLLKSSNYVVGSAGWMIHPNGTAEFAAAAIRGQLVASQIDSRGLSIKDDFGNVILAAGAALPPAYLPSDARKNLANLDWWKEGASIPWSQNGELNQLVQSSQVFGAPAGPRGGNDVVWYCEEVSANGNEGGGWNGGFFVGPLNKNKCYRFVVPIYRVAGSGTSYWGIQDIAQLNTDTNADNPYFCAMGLPVGRWFLFVGYVYPAGTTNASNAGSGVYDCSTGALVQTGTSYNFKSNGSPGLAFRAYQYYASANAAQLFGRPLIECVDGTESSLREYFLPSATLNSAIAIAADGTLSGGSGGKVTLPGMGVNTFRILTRGTSSTQHPAGDPGIYKNGGLLAGVARSYIVGKINRTTGDYVQVGAYDVYGGAGDAAATALNAIGSDFIVVVYSFDEPLNGRGAAFMDAMYRHGASRAVLGSPNFRYRSAYALIGIGGCGEGNGAEVYQGAINEDPAAWIDVGFSVVNGVLTGVSSATTPKSLSDYGYVGALNATANQPDSTVNAGIASAATTAIWTGVSGAGKPQDNATVGATIGTNLVGQFTPANSSTYIADAAIKSAHIESLAVNSAKIADLAVTAAKIADLAVTSAKIADASINSAKIGNLAVNSIHIVGEAVTTSRFGSANGYERYWSGFTSYMPRYQVEDIFSTMYVPVRAGEQTLITVTYSEVSTGNIDERDGDGNAIASGPALISREPRIRINGGAPLTISGPHGSVRALYVATATETVRIDFSVFITAWGAGNYRVSTLIISAFTGRR